MGCIKIRYKNIPNVPTSFLDPDGYAYFDTEQNTDISHYKILTELTDINEMPFDYVLPQDLKASPKNNFLLVEYLHGKTEYSEVEIFNGSFWVPFLMRVLEADSVSINCEFINYSLHWARLLRDSYVKDLPLGEIFHYDYLNGLGNFAPNKTYPFEFNNPESLPCAFPLIDYGDLRMVTDGKDNPPIKLLDVTGEQTVEKCISPTTYRRKVPVAVNQVDFRPWHNAYNIVRRMFSSVGYEFVSPIFETETGRKIITYILDPKMSEEGLDPERVVNLKDVIGEINGLPPVRWEEDSDDVSGRVLFFTGDNRPQLFPSDFGGQISKGILKYSKPGVYDVSANVVWSCEHQTGIGAVVVVAYIRYQEEIARYLGHSEFLNLESDQGVTNTLLEFSNVSIKYGESLEVFLVTTDRLDVKVYTEYDPTGAYTPPCSTALVDVSKTELRLVQKHRWFFAPNNDLAEESIQAASIVDRTLTNLSYLKALSHLLGLKFHTDHAAKKVFATQADKIDFFGNSVDGFFNQVGTAELVDRSYRTINKADKVKSVTLKFRDSDLHSRRIDIESEDGSGVSGEDIVMENDMFEPTYLQEYFENSGAITTEGKLYPPTYLFVENKFILPNLGGELEEQKSVRAVYMVRRPPATWDQLEYNFGKPQYYMFSQEDIAPTVQKFDQTPRVLLDYGSRKQFSDRKVPIFSPYNIANGNSFSVHNLAGHYHPAMSNIIYPGDDYPLISATFDKALETLYFRYDQEFFDKSGYDNPFIADEITLSHLQYSFLVNKYLNPIFNYQVHDNASLFFSKTLREKYHIMHLGKPYDCIVTSIEDFKSCRRLPTIYNFQPYVPKRAPYCIDLTTDPRSVSERCFLSNNPLVSIGYDITAELILLSLSGLNRSPVTSTNFEYSSDGLTWSPATSTSAITATVPNPGTTLYFRAVVNYDDACPDRLTQTVFFNACGNIDNTLIEVIRTVKPDGQVCATSNIVIDPSRPYTLISYEVDLGDGYVAYTEGTELCDIITAVFKIVVKFGICPEVEQELDVNGDIGCPKAEDFGLECVDGWTFIRTGNIPIDYIEDKIFYQISIDGITYPIRWEEWDDVSTIPAQYIRARRVIRFCGECDDICTPIIYCEVTCGEFTITCDDCTLTTDADESCTVTWAGPEGFTATGASVAVEIEGDYTATVFCPDTTCTVEVGPYFYEKADPGTGINGDDIIDV